ncbi:hypothetical protein Salmuc_03829 [Salipiger mucosus DSM 16094]|uniref:Uncharacterized protein n=2 Tax=Salipiger mucosus TaxID=263378 RepID=S9QL61_9RHOB|nr:hypothetical protein Salmuc_03829 [Salipiger mucosus DSM 16094]
MVPVCLDIARNDPARREKLETIRGKSSYRQRDAVMDAGWATMPGAEEPNRDIAQACLASLDFEGSVDRSETKVDEG